MWNEASLSLTSKISTMAPLSVAYPLVAWSRRFLSLESIDRRLLSVKSGLFGRVPLSFHGVTFDDIPTVGNHVGQ